MNQDKTIYQLVIRGNKRLSLIPHDLRYFNNHFVCQRMASSWKAPPAKILGNSNKLCDFILWMLRAPIVTEKVIEILDRHCKGSVEFLPFMKIKGSDVYALNILSNDPADMLFKPDPKSVVYANSDFGNLAVRHGFTGIELADPASNILKLVIQGSSTNVFPGLKL